MPGQQCTGRLDLYATTDERRQLVLKLVGARMRSPCHDQVGHPGPRHLRNIGHLGDVPAVGLIEAEPHDSNDRTRQWPADRIHREPRYFTPTAGSEYLILEPHGDGRVFTVDLAPGSYTVEWFDVTARETSTADRRTVELAGPAEFTAPFASGPAVLFLWRTAG